MLQNQSYVNDTGIRLYEENINKDALSNKSSLMVGRKFGGRKSDLNSYSFSGSFTCVE